MGLDAVELVMDVEKEFDISISDQEAGSTRTIKDLVLLIDSKSRNNITQESIYHHLTVILTKDYGININQIHPEARFIDDLNLN